LFLPDNNFNEFLNVSQAKSGLGCHLLSGCSNRHAPVGAIYKLCIKSGLELLNSVTQRRLRNVDGFSCTPEMLSLHEGNEVL
jgi:hypothetical protein